MDYLYTIINWFKATHIHEQVINGDLIGLYTNPWFMVPFALFLGILLLKKQWKYLLIVLVGSALWWFSGTDFAGSLVVDGKLQPDKAIPLALGGVALAGILVYLFFGRSD
jgi:hypothetical protein